MGKKSPQKWPNWNDRFAVDQLLRELGFLSGVGSGIKNPSG